MAKQNVDLTQRPPRSPRVRLGGYAILPRMLDKGRALLNGKIGEYKFDCSGDAHFLAFVGLTGNDIKKLLEEGKSDGEILAWINANAPIKRAEFEIATWTAFVETRPPYDIEGRDYFNKLHAQYGPKRDDIKTWFDLLDLDDYVSFGGVA